MRISRHKRQVVLFIAAILAPAAVLVGLAGRMMVQDRELAAKHVFDQRRIEVDQVRRELGVRLESIRQAAISRQYADMAIIFTATVEGERLVLPWEKAADVESPSFARHRQGGEMAEFAKKDDLGAAAAYRLALAAAASPLEAAEARLLLARALFKSGKTEEAFKLYRALLNAPADARDEQGVGYRLYALERLVAARGVPAGGIIQEYEKGWLTLPELYLIRPLSDAGSERRISQRIAEMEQIPALAKDFARVRGRIESDSGSAWVPYGNEPWLVTIVALRPAQSTVLLAVSSAKVAPAGVKLRTQIAGADALGNPFPGLYVELSGRRALETVNAGLPFAIWVAGLALVLGVALFGGYLLLRDVNRDIRIAEVRSQFVASVSHELKTPLTAIRMFAETLAMGRSRDERTSSEYLETIVNESERLARLVDNVLDFSKIEQGKKIYRLRPIRLEDVANSAVRAMQFPLAQQGFQLHYSVEEDIPGLQADPDAIQQAILNLLTNAMKYSGDSREIDLRIAACNGDAVIEVVDRGLGLTADESGRVFEKFYRAPSHERHAIAGTGLGLTLVAHIASGHHGRVEVVSAPGEGSTFYIYLPLAPAQARQPAVEARA